MEIQKWWQETHLTDSEQMVINYAWQTSKLGTTDKAVQIKFYSKFGSITKWIPKSVILSEKKVDNSPEKCAERLAILAEQKKQEVTYNDYLQHLKKDLGLKTRVSKQQKLFEIANEQNIKIPSARNWAQSINKKLVF